jgi:UDP-N-acetylmuramate: L-alanyl-gamma-D-glutamyl-meso-diaminopimelate ligase
MTTKFRYHIIAIGGSAMHNIALDLHASGHIVTGSDDEIYEPALSRLKKEGLAPSDFGWNPDRISDDLDFIVLGMHAKADNPELLRAQELGLKIFSYPSMVYEMSKDKKRIVVAGSHGKTTTTAMVMYVLQYYKLAFDYLVGAQIEGFERMVKISDAPIIIIEGDEYLSSPIDRVPKIHHYKPHITVLTGIAWDHINVFPTFEMYKEQFEIYLNSIQENGTVFYYEKDEEVCEVVKRAKQTISKVPYQALTRGDGNCVLFEGINYPISVIGNHNLQNMNAARMICESLDVDTKSFFEAIQSFKGASKRLQILTSSAERTVFFDFAHAPSKVIATTSAVKDWFGQKPLLAVLELHTFSSLNKDFLPQYMHSLSKAENAAVFYNDHTLKMKNMPSLDTELIKTFFKHDNLQVFTNEIELLEYIKSPNFEHHTILMMSSGTFNGLNLKEIQ